MNSRLLITMLCLGAVALACGSLARNQPARSSTRHSGSHRDTVGSTPHVNSNFVVGVEPHGLRFAFKLTNDGGKHVELAFPDGQQYDFTVVDSVGREVYRWGEGRMFTQSVQNRLIDSGDTMEYDERVSAALPNGRYIATATLRSSNFPVTQTSSFVLR